MRRILSAALFCGISLTVATAASAGSVATQFKAGAFGVPWNASKASIEAKYPGGKWEKSAENRDVYCVASQQTLLKLPAEHKTQRLCFMIGSDGTLGSATAQMPASLPSLLAVVNRSRTTFGDFDAVLRDQSAIQSRSNSMLWTHDMPYVVKVSSTNDADGRPVEVTFTIADEAALHTGGAVKVSHQPGTN
jgi:hypothetical protein